MVKLDARGDERVAGGAVDAEQGADVTGRDGVDVLHLVGMHAHHATDLDLFSGAHVDDGVSLGQVSLIDPDIGQLAVLAVFQLEGQGHQRFVRIVETRITGCSSLSRSKGLVFHVGGQGSNWVTPSSRGWTPLFL